MKRYTHKLEKPSNLEKERNLKYFLIPDKETCDNAENKLGQLEDIEEELGIDLITLFKALKNGVWFNLKNIRGIRKKDQIMFIQTVSIGKFFQLCGWYKYDNKERTIICLLEQYGRTWALTKEELL